MALMGLLEPVYRLPMVPPKPENLAQDRKGAGIRRTCWGECTVAV